MHFLPAECEALGGWAGSAERKAKASPISHPTPHHSTDVCWVKGPHWNVFVYFFLWLSTCILSFSSVQFSSVAQLCPTLCDPMNCSTPGLPFHHQILEIAQTHVHWVGDAIRPSHPLSSPSPPTLNLCQHQGLFKWVSSSHQVAKVLEFKLQNQSFQ